MKTPKGYKAITFQELKDMSDDEKTKLLSICHRNGSLRCDTIGIRNIEFKDEENYKMCLWCDMNGDPRVNFTDFSEKILDATWDGEWTYGLFKKIN